MKNRNTVAKLYKYWEQSARHDYTLCFIPGAAGQVAPIFSRRALL